MVWDQLRATYDTVAAKYEARFLDELEGKPLDRALLEMFADAVGDPVIEVGSGPGQVGHYVRQGGRRVVGVDLSCEMARLAASRLDGALSGDMRSLPVATGSVGGVVAFYSLIHLRRPELATALSEFHRVLRPSGHILVAVHEGQGEIEGDRFLDESVPFAATFFELDELITAIRAAGLDVTRSERRAPYPTESTVRLYVAACKSEPASGSAPA